MEEKLNSLLTILAIIELIKITTIKYKKGGY